MLAFALLTSVTPHAWVASAARGPSSVLPIRAASAQMALPRISLPEAVGPVLSDFDLKNPNDLSDGEYDTYSAAAIGGTLLLFLPGAFIFDVTGFVADFACSALLGGGLGAFLALRKDGIADSVNDVGAKLLDAAGGISIPRISLPDAASSVLKDIDLKNPNDLSDSEYNSYSAAAIAGTLVLFLPLALVFDVTGVIADFVLSALIGGGLGAFCALRKDGIADAANKFGGKLLEITGL